MRAPALSWLLLLLNLGPAAAAGTPAVADSPAPADCGVQTSCQGCIVRGCGWCTASSSCVPDEIGLCEGGPEAHIGFIAGQHEGPHHWMCPDEMQQGPVMQAAGECLAMAQLGGLHRPLAVGCVRVETTGWLQIYTKGKEKQGWQKRWCDLQPGFVLACGKTPQSERKMMTLVS